MAVSKESIANTALLELENMGIQVPGDIGALALVYVSEWFAVNSQYFDPELWAVDLASIAARQYAKMRIVNDEGLRRRMMAESNEADTVWRRKAAVEYHRDRLGEVASDT